ncbi:hypothetical protein TUM3792_21460 [Shewanella sp. MBTL60-007]|nr:hypothetical protein TUM3792_21460 [Shewanella sp. MBTL60-007]
MHVFYPKQARGRINVKVFTMSQIYSVSCVQGHKGLFKEKTSPLIKLDRDAEQVRFNNALS